MSVTFIHSYTFLHSYIFLCVCLYEYIISSMKLNKFLMCSFLLPIELYLRTDLNLQKTLK